MEKTAAPRQPVTILTGASAGIGSALARVFARHGHALLLVARRTEKLSALAREIETAGGKAPLIMALDLAQPYAADRIKDELQARALVAEYIVNNAGFGLYGPAAELDRAEQLRMIDLNIRALTDLSLIFVEDLAAQRGGILNVASVAGFLPGPKMAVYYASKAYVLSFSEALHRELRRKGVRVTTLCPGPVPSEFQTRAGLQERSFPKILTRTAEQVAEEGYRGLMRGRRLVIPGGPNRIVSFLPRIVPRALVLAASHIRQKRRT